MRAVTVSAPGTTPGTGPSPPVILDQMLTPQDVGLIVKFGTAVATTKVQWSLDDPFAVYATDYNTNATWVDDKNLTALTSVTAGVPVCAAGFPIPVRAVRINNTAWTSGTVTLTVVQVGGIS